MLIIQNHWFYIPVTKNKNQVILMAAEGSSPTKWINILAFILTVIVNSLAGSTTILGGKFTAEISDANPTLITPAGLRFLHMGHNLHIARRICGLSSITKPTGASLSEKNWLALCLKQLSQYSLAFPLAV